MQRTNTKRCLITRSIKWLSRNLKKKVFWPQKAKFRFFQKWMPTKSFFYRYPKNGTTIIDLSVTKMCTKFQANIFMFCRAMVQNQSNGYDVTFLETQFLDFLIVVRQKITFLELWDEIGQGRYDLMR